MHKVSFCSGKRGWFALALLFFFIQWSHAQTVQSLTQTSNNAAWPSTPGTYQALTYDGLTLAIDGTAGTVVDEVRLTFNNASLFDDTLAMDVNGDGTIDIYWGYAQFDLADNGAGDSSFLPWASTGPIELSVSFTATQTTVEARLAGNLVTPVESNLAGIGLNSLGFGAGGTIPGAGTVTLPEIRTGTINEAGPGSGDANLSIADVKIEIVSNHRHQLIYEPEGLFYMGGTAANGVAGPDGTALNGITFGDGFLGQGAVFDAASETIQLPNTLLAAQNNVTVALWFNTSADDVALFSSVNGSGTDEFRLYFVGNVLTFNYFGTTIAATAGSNNGNWQHVAVTRNGYSGELQLFLNGVLQGTATGILGPLDVAATSFYLGQEQNGLGVFDPAMGFIGGIDDVRVYQRALHDTDINAIYGLGRTVPTAVYGFEGNMNDTSGNGNNGTAMAGATTVTHGWHNSSLSLTGDDGYVDLPHTLVADASQLSISLWFKTAVEGAILSGSATGPTNHLLLYVSNGGQLQAQKVLSNMGTAIVNDNVWHHLLYTHDTLTGATRVYIDGELDLDVTQATGLFPLEAGGLIIGQEQDSLGGGFDPNQNFEGQIDRLTFYPFVMGAGDAKALYAELGTADRAQTHLTLAGGNHGGNNQLNLQAVDGLNRPLTTGGGTSFMIRSGAHSGIISMTDNTDGTYSGTWPVTNYGTDTVSGSFSGILVTDFEDQLVNRPAPFTTGDASQALSVDASAWTDVALADINNDGYDDLILIVFGGVSKYHLGSATGFDAGTPLPPIALEEQVVVGDLNGDDLPDLIVSETADVDRVILNNGSAPYFSSLASLTAADTATSAMELLDVDGDEDLDVAVANGTFIRLYMNDGSAGFATFHDITKSSGIISDLESVDVDGDGQVDLVSTDDLNNTTLYTNSGNAPFFDAADSSALGTGGSGGSIASGDFNGDGYKDVAFSNASNVIYLGTADGSLDLVNFTHLPYNLTYSNLTAADLNDDGADDLIGSTFGSLSVFYSNGSATPFPTSSAFLVGATTVEDLTIGDADGDGDLEIVTISNGSAALYSNQRVSAYAGLSTVSFVQGDLGSPTFITVQAVDHLGANFPNGGDTVAISVTGANTATPAVTDNGDGTYTAVYVPSTEGSDTIAITLNGDPIQFSPFVLAIAGATDPAMSVATVGDGTVGQPTTITIQARDASGVNRPVGGDAVGVTLTGTNAQGFSITDNGDGTYSGSYTPSAAGTDTITILLNGVEIMGSPYTSNVNGVPTAADDVAFTDVNAAVVIAVLNNDTDFTRTVDPATVVASDPPNGTTAVNPNGSVLYTPDLDFEGTDTFTYTYQDDQGATSNVATVTVYVSDGPTANDDSARVLDGTAVVVDVLINDVATAGIDTTSVAIVAGPVEGNAVVNGDGTITYTPTNLAAVNDSFTYEVDDLNGITSATATVTITFMSTPVAVDDSFVVQQGIPEVLDLAANDTDGDGNGTLNLASLALASSPTKGAISIPGDGTVIYTPNPGQSGADSFFYTIADGDGNISAQGLVAITINTPPQAINDTIAVFDSTDNLLDLFSNDFDAETSINQISFEVVTPPSHGSISLAFTGALFIYYTPDPGHLGADSFTYRVADDQGGYSNVATVNLNVLVNIPDPIFKAHLVGLHDTSGDGEISIGETSGVLEITATGLGITDIKGAEAFGDLRALDVSYNLIATLADISNLIHLDDINVSHNVIDTMLGLPPGNAPLALADPFESILNLSYNRLYYQPDLTTNHFTTIDMSYNRSGPPPPTSKRAQAEYFDYNLVNRTTTESVKVEGNGSSCVKGDREQKRAGGILKELNISNNVIPDFDPLIFPTTLENLEMAENRILNFPDLTSYSSLKTLTCGGNRYKDVPIANLPTSLESIDVSGLRMRTQPDFSAFTAMTDLNLGSNRFRSIDPLLLPTSLVIFNMEDNKVSTQPDLSTFLAMTDLDMSDNQLTSIDPLLLPPNLINLDISGNRIPITPALGSPKRGGLNLAVLDLSNNKLTSLSLADVPASITSLVLTGNRLSTLPDLSSRTNLLVLRASENFIASVNGSALPTSLTHLDLSTNALASAPDVTAMANLVELRLNDNQINSWPSFTSNTLLETLTLQNNQLGAVPASSPFPASLLLLDLSGNSLNATPDLSALNQLVSLNLGTAGLSALPDMSHATNLERLLAEGNQIGTLNEAFLPQSLQELNLTQNQLTGLPDLSSFLYLQNISLSANQLSTLGNDLPPGLRELNLQGNQLIALPDFSSAPFINVLDLGQNQIGEIVGALPQGLRTLNLTGNQLTEVPDLSGIIRLWELDLSGNPLSSLDPADIPGDVRELGLGNTGLTSFPDLSAFHILENIDVGGNDLTSLNPLFLPATLDGLDLSGNDITTLPDLSSFLLLQAIDLSGNQITVLDGDLLPESVADLNMGGNGTNTVLNLEFLEDLEDLELGGNQLGTLTSLPPFVQNLGLAGAGVDALPNLHLLTSMETCELGGNELTTLPDLSGLELLTQLGLGENDFEDVSFLPPNVEEVVFGGNDIDPLTIPALASLESLNLSRTGLVSLPDLSGFTAVIDLDLRWNSLTDLTGFPNIPGLGSEAHHVIRLDNNLLDTDDCTAITAFEAITQASGASFSYTNQGDLPFFQATLPPWSAGTVNVLDLISSLNDNSFGYDLNCEE